jgi:hypothetical protein
MRSDFDFMDALYAVAANVFAAVMTVLIVAFDRPADLINAFVSTAHKHTSIAVKFDPSTVSTLAPNVDCFDIPDSTDAQSRQSCIALFYVASQEMDYSNREVRRSMSSAAEAFRLAVAKTCRDDWTRRERGAELPLSASCMLLSQGLASRRDTQ